MSDNPTDVVRPSVDSPSTRNPQQTLATIQEALSGLRYGQVTVVVHNGIVVQIERLEKKRLPVD